MHTNFSCEISAMLPQTAISTHRLNCNFLSLNQPVLFVTINWKLSILADHKFEFLKHRFKFPFNQTVQLKSLIKSELALILCNFSSLSYPISRFRDSITSFFLVFTQGLNPWDELLNWWNLSNIQTVFVRVVPHRC
jgi:hypothetical protein